MAIISPRFRPARNRPRPRNSAADITHNIGNFHARVGRKLFSSFAVARGFVRGLTKAAHRHGRPIGASSSRRSLAQSAAPAAPQRPHRAAGHGSGGGAGAATGAVKSFQGTARLLRRAADRSRQIRVRNSASRRAVLQRWSTGAAHTSSPRTRPGARWAGYVKASASPHRDAGAGSDGERHRKFQRLQGATPLVVYSYRTDQSRRAGRDGLRRSPIRSRSSSDHKYTWLARRPTYPETVAAPSRRLGRRARPFLHSWHSDYNDERARTEIICRSFDRACGCGRIRTRSSAPRSSCRGQMPC